jgi:rhomboid family GlyGly-CTERM serine protease
VVAAVAAAGALVAWPLPATWSARLDWQPSLAASQPWRWWTAAAVHWSGLHLAANLGATALVAALGVVAALPHRVALAWLVAWPLTQLGLMLQPGLLHYGGLSGVLHAGVAAAVVSLLWRESGRRRTIGAVLGAGLLLKIVSEAPWAGPLVHPAAWDIAVAPLAHASGAVAGALCTVAALAWPDPATRR